MTRLKKMSRVLDTFFLNLNLMGHFAGPSDVHALATRGQYKTDKLRKVVNSCQNIRVCDFTSPLVLCV